MNEDKVVKIITEIELLLNDLKSHLNLKSEKLQNLQKQDKIHKTSKSNKRFGLATSINSLITEGFFDASKTSRDLEEEFKRKPQNYKVDIISMALMRLVRKGLLEREGKGASKNPWRYKKK